MKALICGFVILFVSTVTGCGVRKLVDVQWDRHGSETQPGQYPWHVSIYYFEDRALAFKCGGTLISKRVVLTAANCVVDQQNKTLVPQRMIVRLGKQHLFIRDELTEEVHVGKIEIHPNYDSSLMQNDIAKIVLEKEVNYTDYIQPICLWNRAVEDASDVVNSQGVAVKLEDSQNYHLSQINLTVISALECLKSDREFFSQVLSTSNYCAGLANGVKVWTGDSGTGMYFEENGIWKLRGLVSSSPQTDSDASRKYSLFTDVAQYRDWIVDQVSSECGRRNVPISDSTSIIGGEIPWNAIIYYQNNGTVRYLCEGTLVTEDTVLSIAHCFTEWLPYTMPLVGGIVVQLGRYKVHQAASEVIEVQAKTVVLHPKYSAYNNLNNIAILKMKRPVQLTDLVQPACLWDEDKSVTDHLGTAMSWRMNFLFNTVSDSPRRVQIPITKFTDCVPTREYHEYSQDHHFCAGLANGTRTLCHGDTGAGLTFEVEGVSYLRGLLSNTLSKTAGDDCNQFSNVIFTDVAKQIQWLKEEISKGKD